MQPSPPPDTYYELRYSVNIFCALLWTLFGNECDYYKGMREITEMLDLQEVHIIRDSFTPDVCRRITWAILTDGRSFFNTVLVEAQFRRNELFKWPTSLIHKIIDEVRFALPIVRPMYPTKWLITPQLPLGGGGEAGGIGGGRSGGGGGGQGGGGKNDQVNQNPVGGSGGNRRGQQQQRQTWIDEWHPKIIEMMKEYVARFGLQIRLIDLLNGSNKRIADLPTLANYVANGRPYICWAHILGRCTYPNCQFKRGTYHKAQLPTALPTRWSQ